MHVEIEPFKVWVSGKLLYGGKGMPGVNIKGRVFAVSSYAGHVPTFQVMLDTGHLFSYVPPHAISTVEWDGNYDDRLIDDYVFHNCRPGAIAVNRFDHLRRYQVRVFDKNRKPSAMAEYLFSIDWIEANDVLHCLSTVKGDVIFVPQHKIDWSGDGETLPPYVRLREEFKVVEWKP